MLNSGQSTLGFFWTSVHQCCNIPSSSNSEVWTNLSSDPPSDAHLEVFLSKTSWSQSAAQWFIAQHTTLCWKAPEEARWRCAGYFALCLHFPILVRSSGDNEQRHQIDKKRAANRLRTKSETLVARVCWLSASFVVLMHSGVVHGVHKPHGIIVWFWIS